MVNFGIEFETCLIATDKTSWINSLITSYVPIIRLKYKESEDFRKWAYTFEHTILILDDDNILYSFNLNNDNNPERIEGDIENIIKLYNKPLLTIDSTIVCHLTKRGISNNVARNNYLLNDEIYTINLEIVSQILKTDDELQLFLHYFIDSFESVFVKNKSQGIHLNIDVSRLDDRKIIDIIKNQYYEWEKRMHSTVRRFPSKWAVPLNDSKLELLESSRNLTILDKTDSIRFKKYDDIKILELRILSPVNTLVEPMINVMRELLSMFSESVAGGGKKLKRKKTKKMKRFRRSKTRKDVKMKLHPVFVYGSLRSGLQNNYKLDTAINKGLWHTVNEYYMIGIKSGSYPYVIDEQINDELKHTQIYGELYYVDDKLLNSLDEMEGHPIQYKRTQIEITNDKEKQAAFMYILENEELKKGIRENFGKRFIAVNTGDWLDYKSKH